MCFSPTISFIVGGALAVSGILTLKKTRIWQEWFLASVPLFFAAQQIAEGFLWLSLLGGGTALQEYWLTLFYSAFVGIVWPVLIPLSIQMIEPDTARKKMIYAPLLLGAAIALYTLYALLHFGVTSRIAGQCILYESQAEGDYNTILYVLATCTAFFISSLRGIQLLGAINMAAFFIAFDFYRMHYVSVWCLFAAVVSAFIYLHFCDAQKRLSAAT